MLKGMLKKFSVIKMHCFLSMCVCYANIKLYCNQLRAKFVMHCLCLCGKIVCVGSSLGFDQI